ncbi:hypothetical protein ACFS5M_14050 [Lacinutrix iliipiscaria]|uniref:Uncharacterized protein n=1 Tax=Lacinutrix iliipiscaria TaxID=1230532 RepID=A0ABW5WU29_9FLAO
MNKTSITLPEYTEAQLEFMSKQWLELARKQPRYELTTFFDFIMKEFYKKCNINYELLQDLQEKEDAILAYENNWYDTHDLDFIESNLDEYKAVLEKYKFILLEPDTSYNDYVFSEGLIKMRNKKAD